MGFTREAESPCPRVEGPTPQLARKRSLVPGVLFFYCWYQALAGTLHYSLPDAAYPMTARSTSRSRASWCCPCGLAPVVTVAAGTTWGHVTPCYASHHMMLVLLYGLAHNTYPTLKPRQFFKNKTKISRTSGHLHTQTVFFFFLHVAIRNSLRSNKYEDQRVVIFSLRMVHASFLVVVG